MKLRPKRLAAYAVLFPLALCVMPFVAAFCLIYLVVITIQWALDEVMA